MVCFFSSARYTIPLDATQEKKFRALAARGPIYVIGFAPDLRPRCFSHHAQFYLLPCPPFAAFRYGLMSSIGFILALWLILRHGVRIIVAQSPYEGFAGAWAKTITQRLGRRCALVVESHGDFETALFLHRRVYAPQAHRWLMRRTARFTLRRADLLRAVSRFTAQQLRRWAPYAPIYQFPAWTDIDAFRSASTMEAADPSQTILFAGVLTPLKGAHHLLNAFARLAPEFPAARLLLVGRIEDRAYAEELRARVRQTGLLQERVQFIGETPQAVLAALMRQAAVFVLPSYTEGLGRVVFEAMVVGTPVLASAVGGVLELIQDGETGVLTPPGDEAVLEERLRWLLQHPEEARALGQRARGFAERQFSTAGYVDGYQQMFARAQALLNGAEWHDAAPAL